jgi:hypothetical protein
VDEIVTSPLIFFAFLPAFQIVKRLSSHHPANGSRMIFEQPIKS